MELDGDLEAAGSGRAAHRESHMVAAHYGATGGAAASEDGASRRSHRRSLAAGLVLGVTAIAAVAMLGGDGSAGRPAALAVQRLQMMGLLHGENAASAPLVLAPPEDPLEESGATDPEVGTDMDAVEDGLITPKEGGREGGGLEYAKHAQDFYDHMLFNANVSLDSDKSWRYWSRIRVRDEVYYMVQKVENLIKRNYNMHYNVKQDLSGDRTYLKEDVEKAQAKMTDLVREVKQVAEKVGAGLTNLRKVEEEEQRRLEQYKRHYDSDLRRIHAVLSNQTIELEKERHDALRRAYDKQLQKMQQDVDAILSEDRAQMVHNNDLAKTRIQGIQDQLDTDTRDMQDLQHTIFTNVEAAKHKEQADFDNVTAVHISLNTYLHNMQHSLDHSLAKQTSIEVLAKSNQHALASVTTQVDTAAFKLSMLEKKQASDHEAVDEKLKALVTTSEGLDSSLDTQTEAVKTLKDTVEKFATENAEFKKTVEGDHVSLKDTITSLQTEITKADAMKKDIADLQTSMGTQINDIASKIDDLGGTQTTLATSLGQQQTDMTGLQTRIADLESSAKSSSDEAKSDHDRVSAVVEEMQGKLSGLLNLKDRIETLETSLKDNVADLQEKIDAAEATHNGTRDGLLKSMEELEAKLTAQDAVEKNVEATTDTSIDEFKTDLNGLDAFKADSEKSAAELVKKLSDTTESLGILDSKFSGQNTDMDSKISSLQASVDKVPTKVEFEKTIEDALGKAKKAQDKLDEVGKEVADIRADQTNDDGRILTLNGKADEQTNDNDKNWKDVLDMIQQEGDLFSKISKKLKDEDLRKDVDTVFGRTSQPV